MADNPNENYYKPSLGSLTGFDRVDLPGSSPDIVKTGWSIEELRRYLLNENGDNFPSYEWIAAVNEVIQEHIVDLDNPHKVTLEQIAPNFIEDILGKLAPGTPPDIGPFFAYESTCPLPLGNIFPATYQSTNLFRMTEGGVVVDPSTEIDIMGVDNGVGNIGVPLFSAITNTVPENWLSNPQSRINTTVEPYEIGSPQYPFTFNKVKETGESAEFGLVLPTARQAGTVYTATIFALDIGGGGFLILSQEDNPTNTLKVDLRTGDMVVTGNGILGRVCMYPSGVMRISFSFTATTPLSSNAVRIIHRNTGEALSMRGGLEGRDLFAIAHAMITQSAINHPVLINRANPGSSTTFKPNIAKVTSQTLLASMLIVISFDLSKMLFNASTASETLFSIGTMSLTRDQTKVYLTMAGTTIASSTIVEGTNTFAISYSPSRIIFKNQTDARKEIRDTYTGLPIQNLVIGNCSGYLRNFAIYAKSDKARCVEFLTDG